MRAFVDQWPIKRATPWNPQPLSLKNYVPTTAAILTEALLYGVHLVLFAICIYLLLSKRMRLQWLMFAGMIVMFILSTADIAISWHFALRSPASIVQGTTVTFLAKLFPKYMIFVSNNLIAVALLIVRCYVVWGRNTYIAGISSVLLVIATGLGYAAQISNPDRMGRFIAVWTLVTLVLNNILTLLTAGRIWWLSRRISPVLGRVKGRQYRKTSAIIIESGLLYSLSLVLTVGLTPTRWVVLGCAIVIRTVCIMPVIIVVQIAVGHATKPSDMEMTTGIQTERTSQVLDTIIDTGGVVSSSSVGLATDASSMAGHER